MFSSNVTHLRPKTEYILSQIHNANITPLCACWHAKNGCSQSLLVSSLYSVGME